ncbi:M20 metallopeptidase family protein [Paenibacillus lutrae]|uniref:Amidohydrolase n=1 Tax=Paenibacillus lutrae TaxID=2078573 RepID=A0A7X3FGW3_9BACL|nr:M20 family metallopeptidase [Paenibacillus lutrae]MVO99253.1 amidohydrolase [Paenibacillus lutrae]
MYETMVSWRRHLHRHPELSYKEVNTAAFVAEKLRDWGLDVKTNMGGNGLVADLLGQTDGPTVALRADMDALPIQDEKTCEYVSTVPGVMHACGHDAHTSTLLAAAKILSERRDLIQGRIRFIFQHAEEVTPGGAASMIEAGALDGVDFIYGVHLWTPLELGVVGSTPGAMMAAADEFDFAIRGKGGHGGLPHQAVDSVVIGSHVVVNLQTIVSRTVSPIQSCVVTIGSLHGGSNFNVIAESCEMKGTTRTFDAELRMEVKSRVEEIVESTCRMYGAQAEMDYRLGYPPLVNDAAEFQRFVQVASELLPAENVRTLEPVMAAEDFAYYLERIPGCFIFVGAGNPEIGASYPHHHPRFDLDERAMLTAGKLLIRLALSTKQSQSVV